MLFLLRLPWTENGKCLVTRTIRFSWSSVHKMEPNVFMFFLEEITSFAKFHTETSGYVWWSEASNCHLGTPWCSATPAIVGSDRRTGAMQASAMVIPKKHKFIWSHQNISKFQTLSCMRVCHLKSMILGHPVIIVMRSSRTKERWPLSSRCCRRKITLANLTKVTYYSSSGLGWKLCKNPTYPFEWHLWHESQASFHGCFPKYWPGILSTTCTDVFSMNLNYNQFVSLYLNKKICCITAVSSELSGSFWQVDVHGAGLSTWQALECCTFSKQQSSAGHNVSNFKLPSFSKLESVPWFIPFCLYIIYLKPWNSSWELQTRQAVQLPCTHLARTLSQATKSMHKLSKAVECCPKSGIKKPSGCQ